MDKLISNTDFGFYVRELDINDHKKLELRENYDSFLKQPLTLGMFVPCDSDGNVLEEPERRCGLVGYDEQHYDFDDDELREYQEAKERVLFEGFIIHKHNNSNTFESAGLKEKVFHPMWNHKEKGWISAQGIFILEDLAKYNLVLTESAKKQIGL